MRVVVLLLLVGCGEGGGLGAGPCEGRSEERCDGGCVPIDGWPEGDGPRTYAGCASECGGEDMSTTAMGPDGTCWRFSQLCVPDGWESCAIDTGG